MNDDQKITFFGETNFRNQLKRFGIKKIDRRKHMYIVGKTGMGKTTLLENLAMQDIQNGEGVAFIDPHGDTAYKLLNFVPKPRINDVIYFNPADLNYPIGLNVMESDDPERRHFIASGLMSVFKKIFGPDVWSARMEYILGNTISALLEYPDSTLLNVNPMLATKEFRKKVVENVKDPVVKAFWTQEFAKYTERFATEATPAIQNKVGQFTSNPLIRNIVGQTKSSFDFRKAMDERKIIIINVAKGHIGEDNMRLLGTMIVTKLYLAAMSRVNILEEKNRSDFFLYVDEFQNFATESFRDILSEARKYRLSLIMANQYMAQLDEEVRDAVIGNVGTMLSFRVGAEDAEFLEKEFGPEFMATDIVNLGFAQVYLKLMVDGIASRPFSATTLPPIENQEASFRDEILEASRKNYGTPRAEVEERINKWISEMDASAEKRSPERAGTENFPAGEASRPQVRLPVGQVPMYDAVCAVCGKTTKVPFQPDPNRPVFCKEHIGMAGKYKEQAPFAEKRREFIPKPREGEFIKKEAPAFQQRPERGASLKELERRPGSPSRPRFEQPFKKPDNIQVLREALKKSLESKNQNAPAAKPAPVTESVPADNKINSGASSRGENIEL